MEQDRTGLMPIGTFAEATRLSLKALRLYDRLGLLPPAYVDPESSYRYYAPEQLRLARLVMRMRQLGMPLELIQRTLTADPEIAVELVAGFWHGVEQRIAEGRQAVEDVRRALLSEEISMNFVIEQRDLAPQPVASIRTEVVIESLTDTITGSIVRIRQAVGEGSGPAFTLFHGPVNESCQGPIEVCVPTSEEKPTENFQSHTLPGGPAVSTVLTGDQCDFPAIIQAYDALAEWIRSNGHEMAGPPREVYLDEPNETTRPEARMQIVWPYR